MSDLTSHPEMTGAFTAGFLERDDGWPGLRRHYGLRLAGVRTIEHGNLMDATCPPLFLDRGVHLEGLGQRRG